jgi:hypothetical protein
VILRFHVEDARPGSEPSSLLGSGGGCGAGSGCIEVGGLSYQTRRLINGEPVDPDGGVARRTKY